MKKTTLQKAIKALLWTAAALTTLTVLFYAVERWRGARAWARTEAYFLEQGETLDFSSLRPNPVDDAENFCAIPLLASLTNFTNPKDGGSIKFHDAETRNRFLEMQLPDSDEDKERPAIPSSIESQFIDLEGWAAFLKQAEGFDTGDPASSPGEQIRHAFARFDSDFSEIAEAAANRPRSWFPLNLGDNFIDSIEASIPHASDLLRFGHLLTVKGAAAAASGDTETAKKCILIQLRLAEAIAAEPLLINHLVGISILGQSVSIIRQGLHARMWNEDDLVWNAVQIEAIDLIERGANAVRGEMTGFLIRGAKFLKSANSKEWDRLVTSSGNSTSDKIAFSMRFIPAGWLDQNAATGCQLDHRHGIRPMKDRNFSGLTDDPLIGEFKSTTPYNFLAKITLPTTRTVIKKTVQIQVLLDAARAACGLELFYLRNQAYPDSLAALAPEFLSSIPEDPMTGGPLLFKLDENGYRIYSVGINGKDEGGALFRKENGKVDRDRGDWVLSVDRGES